ncbi:hypothetical protein [Polaribacter sp. Q13]|uniref:hypothetical protein n=1 Tax=Polaribacter sp. Q13 TaxID=2806551 RepID=UPI00193B466E|nr:hypothetical protein [Polaribacter sp. Q13]QVY66315.1 hypothetical protein JOP69_03185 [Polaribacter sp. Q13]
MKIITYIRAKQTYVKKYSWYLKIPSPDRSGALFNLAFFGKVKKAGTDSWK